MHKKTAYLMIVLSLVMLCDPCWGMGNRSAPTVNDLANNDAVQQGAGDAGGAIVKAGNAIMNPGYEALNNGFDNSRVQTAIKNGTNIAAAGTIIKASATAAPHVGWIATSAGTASTGDYSGAAIQAVNGATRTATVGYVGTAVGIWAGGKIGAMAGSWGGPLGAGAGFIIGCGAAWVGGKIWDAGIGKGAEALDQWDKNVKAETQYGGMGGRNVGRQNAQQVGRSSRPKPPRPSGGSKPGGRPCTCP